MTNPTYFTVIGDYKSIVADTTNDSDANPDLSVLTATVTFTPMINNGDVILATQATPRPTGFVLAPITGFIDTDGKLKMRAAANGDYDYTPIRLLANTSLLNLSSPLIYKVSFSSVTYDNRPGTINSFFIEASTTDEVVDLISVAQVPGQNAVGITHLAPGAVRLDGTDIIFSFGSTDIPDPVSLEGLRGETGATGAAATISVGTVSTGNAGSSATVTNAGTSSAAVLNFTIPKGDTGSTGSTGSAATINVGTVTTGNAGSSASVTNVGTSGAATFDFTIPKGDKGDTGSTGSTGSTGAAATISVGTVTTGNAGSSASVTNVGTSGAATLNFTIPRGDTGSTGSTGGTGSAATISVGTVTTGSPGSSASVTNVGTSGAAVFDITIPRGDVGSADPSTWTTIDGKPAVVADGATKADARSAIDAEYTGNKGTANGYASLDSAGKVPYTQLPASIMSYLGTWNATTNSPTLADGTGSAGDLYRVATAGSQNLGAGSIAYGVGDYVIYNGSTWEKSDSTDAVASVNGYTGVVSLTKSDIGLSAVDNTADADKPVSDAVLTLLGDYELGIPAGGTAQYWRGNKTWATLNAAAVTDATTVGRAVMTATDSAAARAAVSATSSKAVITAESLGIPTDGVTDAAPIINALPIDSGMIHFSGTMLCKTPLAIPHGVSLVGTGRGYSSGSSIIKFDPTQSWGSNPKLLTLGNGTDYAFSTRVMNATIDCSNIPQSIGVYSSTINEQSGLFNVLIYRPVKKGFYVEGGLTYPAQNWGSRGLEVMMSTSATSSSIGIDIDGGYSVIRDLSDITVTVDQQTYIAGLTAMRLNAVYAGAIRDCHFENVSTGLLIGDLKGCAGLTLDNIHGHATGTDLVVISTPGTGQNHSINIKSLVGVVGMTNLLRDTPRSRTYVAATNSHTGSYYYIGSGSDSTLPVDTDMVEAAGLPGILANKTINTGTLNNGTLTGTATFPQGNILRFPHANESSIYDGSITAGTYSEGLDIVGSQTVAGHGRVISLYGTVQTDAGVKYVTESSTNTITNKSLALGSNTVTGTTAQFNTALSDDDFATLAGTNTLTNKTIDAASNTLPNVGRLVCSTTGGATGSTGANTWAQLANIVTGTNQYASLNMLLGVSVRDGSNTAIVSVFGTSNGTGGNPTVDIQLLAVGGSGGYITADSFKIVSGGWSTDMVLWFRKGADYGQVNVSELSVCSVNGATVSYNNGAGWITSTPTGSVNNVSTNGVTAFGAPVSVRVSVPATSTTAGRPGHWAADSSYHYSYTGNGSTHTWVRSAAASW